MKENVAVAAASCILEACELRPRPGAVHQDERRSRVEFTRESLQAYMSDKRKGFLRSIKAA